MKNLLFIDLETRSRANLKDIGAYNYAMHPSTKVWCMAYGELDGPIKLWKEGDPFIPLAQYKYFVAHNKDFERLIFKHVLSIDIPISRWKDTADIARHHSLPGKLELVGEFLGCPKDMDGNRVTLKLAKPRTNGEFWKPWEKPEDFKKMYDYCRQDVEVSRKIYKTFGDIPAKERIYSNLTAEMNDLGVEIDPSELEQAQKLLRQESVQLGDRMKELTDGVSNGQSVKLAEWLCLPDIRKDTVRDELKRDDLAADRKEVLELRKTLSSSSTRKLSAMQNRLCEDGRLRGSFMFAGAARTGRWSSVGVQLQNLPRGKFEDEWFDFNGKTPKPYHTTIKNMIRGFIKGPFIVSDLAQIECRVLAWYAGQNDLLEQFATPDVDPYKIMASKIYKTNEIDSSKRFVGKQAVLSAGYQCGASKFDYNLRSQFDTELPFELVETIIATYRGTMTNIVEFWWAVQEAFYRAMKGQNLQYRRLEFRGNGKGTVTITLRSGRTLYYYRCRMNGRDMECWGKIPNSSKWGYIKLYGGRLTEHIVSGTSRDVMAEAMVRLKNAGFDLSLTVHDETAAEVSDNSRVEEFHSIMKKSPIWAKGLPIECETTYITRYQK